MTTHENLGIILWSVEIKYCIWQYKLCYQTNILTRYAKHLKGINFLLMINKKKNVTNTNK